MKQKEYKRHEKKSIFRSLFIPLFLIMILQALIFYFAAVYGGIEESLSQNASDILSERLVNRKNEIEDRFNSKWTDLDSCSASLEKTYMEYEVQYGKELFTYNSDAQKEFLSDSAELLIDTLRQNEVNGIFLILNDKTEPHSFSSQGSEQKYGLCIRDMDQESNYSGTEDLLLERAPSSIVDLLNCSLDSWWEAKYSFISEENGDYYYYPLNAAWEHPKTNGKNLAYWTGMHQISGSDPEMLSYSIPLTDDSGYPFAVLGIEISEKYFSSLLPHNELSDNDKACYVLAAQYIGKTECTPITASGALFNRCFESSSVISLTNAAPIGGFTLTGRGDTKIYGQSAVIQIYNNNNPFEDKQLALLALVENDTMFAYIERIKIVLLIAALFSLLLGVVGIGLVSRHFAAPITSLAAKVRGIENQSDFKLERLGILEIDQLVDSIEELNYNVNKTSARIDFFSRMSHDIRTPMNAIISFSSPDMLKGAPENVKDDYLDKINSSGKYLLGLINEVLDIAKIESNKIDLHFETIKARNLFNMTITIIRELTNNKSIRFIEDINIAPEEYVIADEQHINQIIMNLLSNAVKFTPEFGTVRLSAEMSIHESLPAISMLKIIVSDTGIGMSEDFMKHLYSPFEQENSRREGTGLGLSIAKKLTDLMDGTIMCESELNKGTTFTVTVPLTKGNAADTAVETIVKWSDSPDLINLKGKHVLVCEDNPLNTRIISNLLSKMGLSVDSAPDGHEGAEMFSASAENTFDAILMDIQMPVMDGLTAARTIRAMDRRDAASIPIIAMTANVFDTDINASRDAGMNAHLSKPIDPQKIFNTLNSLLTRAG